jgi:hypothetical protein|tara:strand:- start:398 stop:550 length:153 start_codon:yes stop_codon:yes gene_type:complete
MSDLCECGILKSKCTHPNCSEAEKEFDSKILANGTSSKKLQKKKEKRERN